MKDKSGYGVFFTSKITSKYTRKEKYIFSRKRVRGCVLFKRTLIIMVIIFLEDINLHIGHNIYEYILLYTAKYYIHTFKFKWNTFPKKKPKTKKNKLYIFGFLCIIFIFIF